MALVITRTAGTRFYLGTRIENHDVPGTADVAVTVDEVAGNPESVELTIEKRMREAKTRRSVVLDLCENEVEFPIDDLFLGDRAVGIVLLSVSPVVNLSNREVEVARLAVRAPRDVRIIRDNAKDLTA